MIGPVVGRMSSAERPADAKAEMQALQQEADAADRSDGSFKDRKPVAPPAGAKDAAGAPDVNLTVEKDTPSPAKMTTTPPEETLILRRGTAEPSIAWTWTVRPRRQRRQGQANHY